jgi:2-polyprenyl-3-methyl-5-hydroxy-6-metoxy-1,4-benzoquinol methylase
MILKCIRCGASGLQAGATGLTCAACAAEYPVIRGVPRFVDQEFYSGSFGFQWNRFSRTQLDSANGTTQSRDTFVEKTGWPLDELRGARILDAGCGMGRFAAVCADAGADVHAVDLSSAVDAAAVNLAGRPNVHVYQADIMKLPFAEGSFDRIYSVGVLHHTPDTRAAFMRLVPLLKPGGVISIWVYTVELLTAKGGEILRRVTPRLSQRMMLFLARAAVPLYYVHRTSLAGRLTRVWIPTSMHPNPEWRWLDTFDWYAPKYQWKHTFEEVEGWFRDAGLTGIRRGPFPVSVNGQRPAGAGTSAARHEGEAVLQ